jgi:predicted transglutaminase-like cysteine proteinase
MRLHFIAASAVVIAAAWLGAPAATEAAGEHTGISLAYAPVEQPIYLSVENAARPPIGWVEFCAANPDECDTDTRPPRDVVLTAAAWQDLVRVNRWVNETIKPVTDMTHWGVIERWSYPDDGYGDCEDYVLLKRRMLIKAGWPREALLITVVRDRKDDGHAVLTVKTDRGEFILDNQNPEILPWLETGYRFVKRQSQSDQNLWVALSDQRPAPSTVAARRLSRTDPNVWITIEPQRSPSALAARRGSRAAN